MATRRVNVIVCAALAVAGVAAFSGCSWLGKGMEVSDAYKKAGEAKTGSYLTTLEITAPRHGRQKRSETFISSSGSWDSTDPAHPKSRGEVTIDGDTISWVEPGNNRIYVTEDRETDYVKLEPDDRPDGKATGDGLLDAVARAVVNFRDAPPVTNAVGQPIKAIAADISRSKLCGVALRAAARTVNSSPTNDDELGVHFSRRDQQVGTRLCAKQLPSAPTLTFGIDNGVLTDYAMKAKVRDGRRIASVSWSLQLSSLDQPQTGFTPPKVTSRAKGRMVRAGAATAGEKVNRLIDSIPEF